VLFSPEIPGPRIGEARSEWEIFADLGRRVRPDRAHLLDFADADAVRDEIARVVPAYRGIDQLEKLGDQVQWGGTRLCADGAFPTPDGKARFLPVAPTPRERPDHRFVLSTRRGKQFNSMVFAEKDPLTGAGRGRIDVLYSSGGNFLDVLPDPASVEGSLERVPVRVHQDIFVSSQMLVDPGEVVVLLPACTRYEQPGGGTETTTERRVIFSPEIPGPRIGEARSEWEIFAELGRRVRPDRAHLLDFADADAVRDEIAEVVPAYRGVDRLEKLGDQVQWGGTRLCADGVFPTPDGKARFLAVAPTPRERPDRRFVLSTRRGKQFNSMVFAEKDPLTGAGRDGVLIGSEDARTLGVGTGARVVVRSDHGEMEATVHLAPIQPGNVQVFFPEGNVLLPRGRVDPESGVPDYNAWVEIVPR
jgi:predicted molibdopterin-dependent oxidoreductase YjgC